MDKEWPFQDERRVATITLREIIEDDAPILLVTHDADDGSWQFLPGGIPSEDSARVVALEEILALDPSIAELADLGLGWRAWRPDPGTAWQRFEVIERHDSQDDLLVLLVTRDDQVGLTLSFDGYPWHTHPDVIAAATGAHDHEQAWRGFVHDLVSSTTPIAVYSREGHITDIAAVWGESIEEVLDDPYLEAGEGISIRLWNGTVLGSTEGTPDEA